MPGQLRLFFSLLIFFFFLYSSYCKLEFLLVPVPSPLLPPSSSYQISPQHLLSMIFSISFFFSASNLTFSSAFLILFLLCCSLFVLLLCCILCILPMAGQPQCPLLMISFFLYQMLPRSTRLSHILYGDVKILHWQMEIPP